MTNLILVLLSIISVLQAVMIIRLRIKIDKVKYLVDSNWELTKLISR